jgi:hypothetical protein
MIEDLLLLALDNVLATYVMSVERYHNGGIPLPRLAVLRIT